ncbi:MAG TPA: AmmeMemoRadiSam system protein A [Pyrinomonadaceae bacterium]|nr:AmmeMemoRadiSam system protein A [Pyrinomonadaceae bacterium]
MGNASAIVFTGIAPHPPIMVPEVGREAIAEVRGSISAMAELTRRIIESGAETVVLISPHAPLDPSAFVVYNSPVLQGDFANFRAPKTRVEFAINEPLLETLIKIASAQDFEVLKLDDCALDHGTAVPLYFLDRNGWRGRVVALGYSFLSNSDHLKFGRCLRAAAEAIGGPVALVASGDLSHRLKPDAPAGYNPAAHFFDEEVVRAIDENSPDRIIEIDQDLRRTAGECGYRSMLIALGATHELASACEVLNYEAPFGVGYLVAQLTNLKDSAVVKEPSLPAETRDSEAEIQIPALARQAVETFVLSGKVVTLPEAQSPLLAVRAACFVSIKTNINELRGCIGTIDPVKESLAEEIVANAISAATRDPRFPPVSQGELANLRYSVDILSVPEAAELADLDPQIYGLIVENESGSLRGLLLPDINGVETVSQQLEIARRKAGIAPGTRLKLSRFRVDRYLESS